MYPRHRTSTNQPSCYHSSCYHSTRLYPHISPVVGSDWSKRAGEGKGEDVLWLRH